MSDPVEAAAFWQGRCLDCAHPEHEMTCHEMVPNGDPSNGPAYCPCSVNIELMEQEITRLRTAIRAESVGTVRSQAEANWRESMAMAEPTPPESAGTGLDDPKFRAAVDAVFAAPGEFGPAKGYYGEATDHFIDMLKAEYARLSSSDTERRRCRHGLNVCYVCADDARPSSDTEEVGS